MKLAPTSGLHKQQVTQKATSSITRQGQRSKPRRVNSQGRISKKKFDEVFVRGRIVDPREAAVWDESRDHLGHLTYDPFVDPKEAARRHFSLYPDHPPDDMVDTTGMRRRKMLKMFYKDNKPAQKLFGCLDQAHHYTLHAEHLELPVEYGDPEHFYLRDYINGWRTAVKTKLKPTLWWKLELATRVHVHVIASHDAGLEHIERGGEVIKPIYDPEGIMTYLMKPKAPYTERNLGLWIAARRMHIIQFPHMSGSYGLPNKRTWH